MVRKDGDFLVRESQANAGQYVLTGMQGSNKKHLLLIDPEGVVSVAALMKLAMSLSCTRDVPTGQNQGSNVRERESLDQLPQRECFTHHFCGERVGAADARTQVLLHECHVNSMCSL